MTEYKLNLKELDPSSAEIQGVELALVNKEDSSVYLSSKSYVDKLFKLIGYKSLGVIKILEEYAGKTVSSIGNLDTHKIYIDDITESFVVTTPQAVEWVRAMNRFLGESTFNISSVKRPDTYYYWDQIVITNSFGSQFVIYVDLCDEYVQVLAISYDDQGVLVGVANEGKYEFSEGQSSFDSFKVTISGNVDVSKAFKLDQTLSVHEYVEMLKKLGYVGKKKKRYYVTDKADEVVDYVGNLEIIVDDCNDMTWIQRRVNETPDQRTFKDVCQLISLSINKSTYWNFLDFYSKNYREDSDMFNLKN